MGSLGWAVLSRWSGFETRGSHGVSVVSPPLCPASRALGEPLPWLFPAFCQMRRPPLPSHPSIPAPHRAPSLPERTTEAEALLHVLAPAFPPEWGRAFVFTFVSQHYVQDRSCDCQCQGKGFPVCPWGLGSSQRHLVSPPLQSHPTQLTRCVTPVPCLVFGSGEEGVVAHSCHLGKPSCVPVGDTWCLPAEPPTGVLFLIRS